AGRGRLPQAHLHHRVRRGRPAQPGRRHRAPRRRRGPRRPRPRRDDPDAGVAPKRDSVGPPMNLAATLRGTTYRFRDVKDVLAKANEEKSGDRLAGVAAESVSERVAAKRVLAELTLADLHENPVVPAERDAVTRLILDDLPRPGYEAVRPWAVGRLREDVLERGHAG